MPRRAPAGGDAPTKDIEPYEHLDKERLNNPPAGLVTAETDPVEVPRKGYSYDPHLDPVLQWAGKAERTSFEVPVVSLHVHERIEPLTIIDAVRQQRRETLQQRYLFESPKENPPLREAVDFYRHAHSWSNRLVAGDSLLVMTSLLEKEGMAGQVQMIYLDPPYGVRYGSNFQPFVGRRDVAEGDRDQDLTREPEMLRAFRDTWELGIHSYLSYLRDRLLLSRELLSESGSIFVQISDENLHHVRELLDEVFGTDCLVVTIPIKKKGSQVSGLLDPVNDYLLWYSRSPRAKGGVKFRALFQKRELNRDVLGVFRFVELPDGSEVPITAVPQHDGGVRDYTSDPERLLHDWPGARLFRSDNLTSGGVRKNQSLPYTYRGVTYNPGANNCWKATVRTDDGSPSGMDRLADAGRLIVGRNQLGYKRYHADFGFTPLSNWWDGLGGASDRVYVVQTNPEIVQRCILMTTEPGDLVMDPTCGSGTTAFVAEQWGRRWITCDTSRVAVTLAKQRLMTSSFAFYELAHPAEGVGSGFKYHTVSHVELGQIANGEPPSEETLYDQPLVDRSKARVTGPFTVEAVPAAVVHPIGLASDPVVGSDAVPARADISRDGATLHQREWREQLLRSGVRGRNGQRLAFTRVEPLSGTRYLQADAEVAGDASDRAVIAFGPEDAPLGAREVEMAIEEAQQLVPKPRLVVFAAFQFDPEAAKDIDEIQWAGVTLLKAQMTPDLLVEDLKKKQTATDAFWLVGKPDAELRRINPGREPVKWQVEVRGFDYFDVQTGQLLSGGADRIAMWLLDTDYDGRSLFPRQVFFPMASEGTGWDRLARALRAELDEERIDQYRGTVSLPFALGPHRRVAIKIVDDRGVESLSVLGTD